MERVKRNGEDGEWNLLLYHFFLELYRAFLNSKIDILYDRHALALIVNKFYLFRTYNSILNTSKPSSYLDLDLMVGGTV